jgi:hypothetical protein
MIRIEISNLDQVIGKVLQFVGRYDGVEQEIMQQWAELLDSTVKPKCPIDTGYMITCVHPEMKNGKISSFWYGIRDSDCYYAKFVEFAWSGRSTWFRPAVEAQREKMAQIYRDVLLERAGLK